jgi:hypothetical protein
MSRNLCCNVLPLLLLQGQHDTRKGRLSYTCFQEPPAAHLLIIIVVQANCYEKAQTGTPPSSCRLQVLLLLCAQRGINVLMADAFQSIFNAKVSNKKAVQRW